jgi:hypothetical protein
MNKIILFFFIVFLTTSCIKKTYQIAPQIPSENSISGTIWTDIDPNFVSSRRIMGMDVINDKLLLTYASIYSISAYYSENNGIEQLSQNLQSGLGFEKIETLNNVVYGIGLIGTSGVHKFNPNTTYDNWSGIVDVNTNVYAFAEYNSKKVVACGVSPYVRINSSGSSYSLLGNNFNGTVNDLLVFNGKLIAAGSFTAAGSTTLNRIAQWNGSEWQPLMNGLNGNVSDLIIYQNKLIALGKFTLAGSISTKYVAVWNGSSWSALGSGLSGGFNGALKGIVYNNDLIIAGDFSYAGGVNSKNIIKWNGISWQALANGSPYPIGELCVYKDKLYIANALNITNGNFLKRLD